MVESIRDLPSDGLPRLVRNELTFDATKNVAFRVASKQIVAFRVTSKQIVTFGVAFKQFVTINAFCDVDVVA
jgi:hypothetical protein